MRQTLVPFNVTRSTKLRGARSFVHQKTLIFPVLIVGPSLATSLESLAHRRNVASLSLL